MVSEYSERILQEARKWVGRETTIRWARYPVEREPIRRWCQMVDWPNPLYVDEAYAQSSKWGSIVCPPLMIPVFASAVGGQAEWPWVATDEHDIRPPTPGKATLVVSTVYNFYEPVRIGDRIGSKSRVEDIYIKPMRKDPEAFWTVMETFFVNQREEKVAVCTRVRVNYRTPGDIASKTTKER